MNVVCHATVPQHAHAMFVTLRPQHVEVRDPVVVDEKHVLPIVAALRNMMREAGNHPLVLAWMEDTATKTGNKIGGCGAVEKPRFESEFLAGSEFLAWIVHRG